MLSITLKIAVDAPIPSASVRIAITANPGVFPRFLTAYRTSCPSVSMCTPQFDHPPLPSPLASATPGPTHPIVSGGTCPACPEHLGDPVGSPALSVRCSGGSSDPLFLLFQSTHPAAVKFDANPNK